MLTLYVIALFLSVAVALFVFGAAIFAPSSPIGERIRIWVGEKAQPRIQEPVSSRLEQTLQPLSDLVPKSPKNVSKTRLWLMQAGFREDRHLTVYFGARVLLAGCLLALVLVTGAGIHKPYLLVAAPALGYFLPRFMLKRRMKARQLRIRLGMADALDLMVIAVEAGLGLDQAVQRVGVELRTVHPELSDEFHLVNLEMRAGKPRSEALRNLALRTGVDDIRALVAVLVQTDRFGTSVAQALRVHSDALRTERRQRAEEAAAKTTIKMIPVLVFFIFPSMFVVTLGAAMIHLYRTLWPIVHK